RVAGARHFENVSQALADYLFADERELREQLMKLDRQIEVSLALRERRLIFDVVAVRRLFPRCRAVEPLAESSEAGGLQNQELFIRGLGINLERAIGLQVGTGERTADDAA